MYHFSLQGKDFTTKRRKRFHHDPAEVRPAGERPAKRAGQAGQANTKKH
jgi:hypothetical protein